MKKYKIIISIALLVVLLLSCVNTDKGGVLDNFSAEPMDKNEQTKPLVADLSLLIDNTDYIIFSVRSNQIVDHKKSSYDSGYNRRDWYNNYLDNLIFQNTKTQETHILTKKKIKIISYERLIDSLDPSLSTTLYQVIDSFPENDKHDTFTALYLSTNKGRDFTKITKVNEHLRSWKYIPETGNIYFITNNNSNNNRKLDDKDIQSMHSVNVNSFKRTDLLLEELRRLKKKPEKV